MVEPHQYILIVWTLMVEPHTNIYLLY